MWPLVVDGDRMFAIAITDSTNPNANTTTNAVGSDGDPVAMGHGRIVRTSDDAADAADVFCRDDHGAS